MSKQLGTIDDLYSKTTTNIEITYNDKKFKFEVKEKLSADDIWNLVDNNTVTKNGKDDIKLNGFIKDYLKAKIVDSSLDKPNRAFEVMDFQFSQKLMDEIGNPLDELNDLGVEEGN